MIKKFLQTTASVALIILLVNLTHAQNASVPTPTMLQIVRAEDELRFDKDLQQLLKSRDAVVRARAALAVGRTGDETAVNSLIELLDKDADETVRLTAAFALGEIESIKAADRIQRTLDKKDEAVAVRARALEAAGKIVAANPKDQKAIDLGETILDVLEAEHLKTLPDDKLVLLGLTAALRARAKDTDVVVAKFLSSQNPRVRADALNVLVRLRAKNDDLKAQYRALLMSDDDAVVRANAARAAGAAEDKEAFEMLLEAAANDDDNRVRVSAIRALANLNDKRAAAPLLDRADKLFAVYKAAKTKKIANPAEKNELLEIWTALGKILANSKDERAVKLLKDFRFLDDFSSPETETAFAQITPDSYASQITIPFDLPQAASKTVKLGKAFLDWRKFSSVAGGLNSLASIEGKSENVQTRSVNFLRVLLNNDQDNFPQAIPEILRAYSAFKTNDLLQILNNQLKAKDVIVRATAAELLGESSFDRKTVEALAAALREAEQNDQMNDASLAILDASAKLFDKMPADDFISNEIFKNEFQYALRSPDYLVRRKTAQILKAKNQTVAANVNVVRFPEPGNTIGAASETRVVRADYARAVARRNNQIKAVVATEKGAFTIELKPEDAPLTVENFVKLAQSNYFNGIQFHRVVPNFVVQGGDPRGDGNGSPGYAIRDEINMLPFERGWVGMALSGKDTGGSQWFVTHSPQPHLDGGYTVFGFVDDAGMRVIDNIARGDRILNIKIIEANAPRKIVKPRRKRK